MNGGSGLDEWRKLEGFPPHEVGAVTRSAGGGVGRVVGGGVGTIIMGEEVGHENRVLQKFGGCN